MNDCSDPRNIALGREIPTHTYSDQPYVVQADDGAWVCVVTTGPGLEGARGQHIVSLRSSDQGRTWSEPVDVEPSDGPEASYAVLLKAPGGRLFCFYNHNTDDVRAVKADDPPYSGGLCPRVDSQGYFVFKFSDSCGKSWSAKRYPIPVRAMAIDRENPYKGGIRYFWNVGKPFIHNDAVFVPLTKVGGLGHGFFTRSEGVLLRSSNLLHVEDPDAATWETLPDGDEGLRAPEGGGPIAEEQSFVVLSDGSFYCVYRTIDGHPAYTISRDGGHTWTKARYQRYADGRTMKHPRAANFVWKCSNGRYLYWFHNHGGAWYQDRNPAWLCGGVESDTLSGKTILWSQPEIVLYDDDPFVRISYPDLIETGFRYFLTETQKDIARVHGIDPKLVKGLWGQFEKPALATEGLILSLPRNGAAVPGETPMPSLPAFCERDSNRPDYASRDLRAGFTLELVVDFDSPAPGQVLLDNRLKSGKGFALQTTTRRRLEIMLNDGRTENRWTSDPDRLSPRRRHQVAVLVDGGPKIIFFVVDGRLCDGSDFRQFGWGRFSPILRDVNGSATLRIGPTVQGKVVMLRVYNRALRVSEIMGNHRFRALGLPAAP